MARTHYDVLGIPPEATAADVKAAYRRAALSAHPDRGGDAERFHAVARANEVLSDPVARARYDRELAVAQIQRQTPAARPGAASAPANPPRRGGGAAEPARYVPADIPRRVRLLPLEVAEQQVHGAPRRRGLFEGGARFARETRMVELIRANVLSALPAARLVSGLVTPDDSRVGHAILTGYRLAILDSCAVGEGVCFWDGTTLRQGRKTLRIPDLRPAVRGAQEAFGELNVSGWLSLVAPGFVAQEPVVDYARGAQPAADGGVAVVNPANLFRELKLFLGTGPQPNVVEVALLARLLGMRA
ncbi:MAG: J domain-containing protein [Candidatus Nanopelagicales bacterium]